MDNHRPVITIHSVSPAAHEALATGGAALIGIRMRNAYFNPLNLFEIARWAAQRFSRIVFICSDEPAVHTLRALGYDPEEAWRKARTQYNYLSDKCEDVCAKLGIHNRSEVLRWAKVQGNPAYERSLQKLSDLARENAEFHTAVKNETQRVIGNSREPRITQQAVETGMQFLLEEYALIAKAQEILGLKTPCAYIYHRPVPILDSLLDGDPGFHGISADQVGTLICEVVWPDHSVTTLPKTWSRKVAGTATLHGNRETR